MFTRIYDTRAISICRDEYSNRRRHSSGSSFLLDARQQTLNVRVSHMQTSPQSSIDLHGIKKLRSGKVREVFDLDETLLFVVTDRISAFDVILPDPIPYKGAVLNQISAFWFKRFDDIRNHFVTATFDEFPKELQPFREQLAGRSMIVKKTKPLPVNAWCVVIWPVPVGRNIRNR